MMVSERANTGANTADIHLSGFVFQVSDFRFEVSVSSVRHDARSRGVRRHQGQPSFVLDMASLSYNLNGVDFAL